MNASLFNISPGISSGTMNLAMPFLAANAGTGFGETDLYDSLALELGSSEADPHALPQVIQGAPVQHSSIVGAWRRHALEEGRVSAAPLQDSGDTAESNNTSLALRASLMSAVALFGTACSPEAVADASTEALVVGGVVVSTLAVATALLVRRFMRSRKAEEPIPLTKKIVEIVEEEGIKLAGNTHQLEYLVYNANGLAIVDDVGDTAQRRSLPPVIEFATTEDGRYVARNIARAQGIQPRILRDGTLHELPSNGWAELKERDNILLVGLNPAAERDATAPKERVQFSRQLRYQDSGGARLLKIQVNELPSTPVKPLEALELQNVPATAIISFRDRYVRASLSEFKGDSLTESRVRELSKEVTERYSLIDTWQRAPHELQEHYRNTEVNADRLGARIPQAFILDYTFNRASEAMSMGYRFGSGGNALVEEMIARLQAKRERRRVFTKPAGTARRFKAIDGGANLFFGDEGSFERTFNFGDPKSKEGLREAQLDQPVRFSIYLDPDGYLRLNKHDEEGRLILFRADASWKWQYFTLSVDRDRGQLLQEGDAIAYNGRAYRVHTARDQVMLLGLGIDPEFLITSKKMARPPLPAPARTRLEWVDALSSKRVRLQQVRDWMAQGNQMPTQMPVVDKALQMIDEAVLHDRQLSAHQSERLQRTMKFVEQLEELIKQSAAPVSEPEVPAEATRDEDVAVVMRLSDLKAAHKKTLSGLKDDLAKVEDPKLVGYIQDMIETVEQVVAEAAPRQLNPTEQLYLEVVQILIGEAQAGEATKRVNRLREMWDHVRWIARFEEENSEQRKFLDRAMSMLNDAIQAKAPLQDPAKKHVTIAMQFVDAARGLESFKDLRATVGALDNALETAQESGTSLELDLPEGHTRRPEAASPIAALTQQQADLLVPYLKEREAVGLQILEPLGHWDMDVDPADIEDSEGKRVQATVPPPAPESEAIKELRAQRTRVYRLFQLMPDGVVGNILNRADSALWRRISTGADFSYADRKAVKLALSYVSRVEALPSYQEMRRLTDPTWRDTDSQVRRLVSRRRVAEKAFLRKADRMARETLPIRYYSSPAVTPISKVTIAAELRYRYPALDKRQYRPFLDKLVDQVFAYWKLRGRPGPEVGFPGLPPERIIRRPLAMLVGELKGRSAMRRLHSKLSAPGRSRSQLSDSEQEAFVRLILLAAGGHV